MEDACAVPYCQEWLKATVHSLNWDRWEGGQECSVGSLGPCVFLLHFCLAAGWFRSLSPTLPLLIFGFPSELVKVLWVTFNNRNQIEPMQAKRKETRQAGSESLGGSGALQSFISYLCSSSRWASLFLSTVQLFHLCTWKKENDWQPLSPSYKCPRKKGYDWSSCCLENVPHSSFTCDQWYQGFCECHCQQMQREGYGMWYAALKRQDLKEATPQELPSSLCLLSQGKKD